MDAAREHGRTVMTGMSDEREQEQVAPYPCGGLAEGNRSLDFDPQQAARTIGRQAATLRSLMPTGASPGAGGGDPEFDQALIQVLELIGEAWPAESASVFSWRRGSAIAEAMAGVIAQTAAILDGLAVDLAAIQTALEEQAYVASRYGVMIGTDGQPPPMPAGPHADASERHWAIAYKLAHERAMADARQARQQAASRLTCLYEQVMPPQQQSLAMASGKLFPVSYVPPGR